MYTPHSAIFKEQTANWTLNRVVYALIIINKAGGLIYQRDFADGLNKLSINDYLVLAGTFHGYGFPPTSLQLPSVLELGPSIFGTLG
jgi:Sybindin-like family